MKLDIRKLWVICCISSFFNVHSQVGIGTTIPNKSSALEITSVDKGVLFPRVALSSTQDISLIKNGNVESLFVYNTATIADVSPGYYYWRENKWEKIVVSSELSSLENGKSAFEVWEELSENKGKTKEEYFAYLKGDKGEVGPKGDSNQIVYRKKHSGKASYYRGFEDTDIVYFQYIYSGSNKIGFIEGYLVKNQTMTLYLSKGRNLIDWYQEGNDVFKFMPIGANQSNGYYGINIKFHDASTIVIQKDAATSSSTNTNHYYTVVFSKF